jgi:hypothetical protein
MYLRNLQLFKKSKNFRASSGVAASLSISEHILFILATNWALLSARLPLDMWTPSSRPNRTLPPAAIAAGPKEKFSSLTAQTNQLELGGREDFKNTRFSTVG